MSEEKNINTEQTASVSDALESAPQKKSAALPPHKEYAKRMLEFSNFYVGFIIVIGCIMASAVALAVIYNVLLGVAVATFGAVFYVSVLSDNLSRTLGFRYVSLAGGIRLTMCRARYGEVMWVPGQLMGFDVIAIGDGAFKSPKNGSLKKVFLPRTLKSIGKDVFSGCEELSDIYYQGSEEEFSKIESLTDLSAYRVNFDAKYPPMLKKKKKSAGAAKK